MEQILKRSLNNREQIIRSIEQEIVGPGEINNTTKLLNTIGNTKFTSFDDLNKNYHWMFAGVKEEVIQRDSPSRRYAAAMLYPIELKEADVEVDNTEITEIVNDQLIDKEKLGFYDDIDKQDNTELFTDNNDEVEEIMPKIRQDDFMPSSMGITFCLAKHTQKFDVGFSGGMYIKHKIYKNIKAKDKKSGNDKSYTNNEEWWLRKSIEYKRNIKLSDFDQNKKVSVKEYEVVLNDMANEKVNKVKLKLHVQCRFKEEYILCTVTILNVSTSIDKHHKDEFTIFQSQLSISAEVGEFLNYPKASERNLGLTKDEWNNELLFKNKSNYAFGHGCSTKWNQNEKDIKEIHSTFIPTYETVSMTPNVTRIIDGKEVDIKIKMNTLMNVDNHEEVLSILEPLVIGYEEWIEKQEEETLRLNLKKEMKEAADLNLAFCKDSLRRMKKGLCLLKSEKVFEAFKLANKAILLQQINGKTARKAHYVKAETSSLMELKIDQQNINVRSSMQDLNKCDNSWRAFQIAFFLLSIQSLVEKESIDRETVDLIWFPTGGGKTEAYLGVAAFQMFYRRLVNPNDAGVDIMMRYTLRLLTADQFQRASRLICAMEFVRRNEKLNLGSTPYSIGIWVGSKTSPNTNKDAIAEIKKMRKPQGVDNLVLTRCPWCGCEMGKVRVKGKGASRNQSEPIGFRILDKELVTHCPDKSCDFNKELPIYFVDEIIYQKKPTFLIGTIDKFVQLSWRPEARSLFGLNEFGQREISPPQIIVQDELHLISGPLGTLAGLYEVLIEELCIDDRGKAPIKPKIISATATIKEFEEQAKALFGRNNARLFPSPGIDIDNSYFSKIAVDLNGDPMPGRKYAGVFASRVRILMAQVMTYSAILQKVESLPESEKDPYWTLLSFYNSLRDLGAGLNLFNSDIPTYIDALNKREEIPKKEKRYLYSPLELTSRKQSNEIAKTIDDLNVSYDEKDAKGRTKALTSCLASNIIEVGVDIDRLSLMGIIGQPKMTAQYIQVSGRVGRRPYERPGLIVTVYSNQNSRDKSHFEHFNEYHQRLYAQVETTSLTPFSTASLERGLTAVVIGFLRQRLDMSIATQPRSNEVKRAIQDERFIAFRKRFKQRIEQIDADQLNIWQDIFKGFMDALLQGRYEAWRVSDKERGLMYQAGNLTDGSKYPGSIPVINSLRSVDAESRASIVSLDKEEDEFSWEDDE